MECADRTKKTAVHQMIRQFNTQIIDMTTIAGFNRNEFTNINTPQELENLTL